MNGGRRAHSHVNAGGRDRASLPASLLAPVATGSPARATQPAPGVRLDGAGGIFSDITTEMGRTRSANDHMHNCLRSVLFLFAMVVMVGGGPIIIILLVQFFNEFPMIPRVVLGIIFFVSAKYLWGKKQEQQKRQARLLRARTLRTAGEASLLDADASPVPGDACTRINTGAYFGAPATTTPGQPNQVSPSSAENLLAQLAALPAVGAVQPVRQTAIESDAALVVEGVSVFANPSYQTGSWPGLATGVVDDVPDAVTIYSGTVRTFSTPMGVAVTDEV